jgi:hypothetical protein
VLILLTPRSAFQAYAHHGLEPSILNSKDCLVTTALQPLIDAHIFLRKTKFWYWRLVLSEPSVSVFTAKTNGAKFVKENPKITFAHLGDFPPLR